MVKKLFEPLDIASLVVFRVAFGGIMIWEMWRYYDYGWIKRYYIDPEFYFSYLGFEWLHPWPGNGMYIHFGVLALLGLFIVVGFAYRLSTTLFFLGFTYVFLLDESNYLNHFYLVSLMSLLMIFVPTHRWLSVDAMIRPGVRSQVVPTWSLWLLRAQLGIVYVYAAIAKMNWDWLRGQPMIQWLYNRRDYAVLGPFFEQEWFGIFFSYGGLLLDLLVVPFLLWKRTRWLAYAAALSFHLLNNFMFGIGIFPWFMIAATTLFFSPSWPRGILFWLKVPSIDHWQAPKWQDATVALLAVYMALQLLVPLRHWLYPGDVAWSEEGHRFSWRMKLRDKDGDVTFYVTDPATMTTWPVDARDYLRSKQYREMDTRPDMIVQFAHYIEGRMQEQGYGDLEVRAWANVSLNGRLWQPMIDPTVDLTQERLGLQPVNYILPLQQMFEPTNADPIIMVMQHEPGEMALINLTATPLPMHELSLGEIEGGTWSVDWLLHGGCVRAYETMPLEPSPITCNEAPPMVMPALPTDAEIVWRGQPIMMCDRPTCVTRLPLG